MAPDNSNRMVFIVLLTLNIILIVFSFLLIGRYKNLKQAHDNAELELMYAKTEQERILQNQIEINRSTIDTVLTLIDGPDPSSNEQILCMLVPPFPCSACFERELASIKSILKDNSGIVLVPGFRARDVRIQLHDFKNATVVTYDAEKLKDENLRNIDQIVYFTMHYGKVNDVFITAKNTPDASQWYLERIITQIQQSL